MKNANPVTLICAIILVSATLLVFWNTTRNPPVYDDLVYLEGNTNLDNPSNLKYLFTSDYFRISGERSYRPVATALAFFDAAVGGRNPVVFRITSIAVHIVAGMAIFLCILSMGGGRILAFFTSALFLLHPLHTEAVNGSSFIEDPLSTAFFFMAFLSHLIFRKSASIRAHVAALVFSFLAMLSKESAAMLPFSILVYEWTAGRNTATPDRKLNRAAIATHFGVLLIYLIIRFVIFSHPSAGARAVFPADSTGSTIAIMSVAFLKYLKLFLVPSGLSIEHCIGLDFSLSDPVVVFSFAVHLLLLVFGFVAVRINRLMSFSVFFYFLNMLPVSNIVPFGAVFAERYVYLPLFGLCLLFSSIFLHRGGPDRVAGMPSRTFGILLLICASIFFSLKTVERNRDWSNPEILWGKAVVECPESSKARMCYGRRLIEEGKPGSAIPQLRKAVQLDPHHYEALLALGSACFAQGDLSCAGDAYSKALSIHPSNDVRYNLALLSLRTGKWLAAKKLLIEILDTQPGFTAARYLLGNAYLRMGNYSTAEKQYLRVLSEEPGNIDAMGNLGVLYRETGRPSKARKQFLKILAIQPGNEFALRNLDTLESEKPEPE